MVTIKSCFQNILVMFKIIPNGVDDDLFLNMDTKKSGEIVFSGNLQRFNDNRGLDFIINSFLNENMPEVYSLKIIGGPFSEVKKLEEHVSKLGLKEKIKFLGRLDRKLTIDKNKLQKKLPGT